MPTRSTPWPVGAPCWVDLAVPDVPAATGFYGDVLGWSFADAGDGYGNYRIAQVDGHAAAGVGPAQAEGQPTAWTVYLASDDVDGTAKRITDNGGTVLAGPADIDGTGRMLVATDPTGGVFGVWQAGPMIGAEIVDEPGGLVWEDARLTDPETGKRFYSEVFGYTYAPVPSVPASDYGTFSSADGQMRGGMGGMMGAPAGTPSHWLPYFGVANADAVVGTAQRSGAQVLMRPEDTPFGRIAVLTDPFGAMFAVHQGLPQ